MKPRKMVEEANMAKYTPPEQSRRRQWFDIAFVVAAIFLALWLPLKANWIGATKVLEKIENPTWETLKQTPVQVEQWIKLGYADAAAAHDIIQNKWDYSINWTTLILLTVALVGYFVFLFMASDREYREVINEHFGEKK
jgi:hypothetical protein